MSLSVSLSIYLSIYLSIHLPVSLPSSRRRGLPLALAPPLLFLPLPLLLLLPLRRRRFGLFPSLFAPVESEPEAGEAAAEDEPSRGRGAQPVPDRMV